MCIRDSYKEYYRVLPERIGVGWLSHNAAAGRDYASALLARLAYRAGFDCPKSRFAARLYYLAGAHAVRKAGYLSLIHIST